MQAETAPNAPHLNAMAVSLIASIGRTDFQFEMARALRQCLAIDAGLILLYRKGSAPRILYNDWVTRRGLSDIRRYLGGPYRHDPFYQLAADNQNDGLYRLKEIAPARFDDSAYYRDYYRHSGLLDEFNFMFSLDSDRKVAISLGRGRSLGDFSADDEALLASAAPLLQSAVVRHWRDLRPETLEPSSGYLNHALGQALARFGSSVLTERECEVANLILRGYSLKGAAERLGISPATVKLHRRNLYAKLDINSQTALFALFIESVSAAGSVYEDPLESYLKRPSANAG
ncbi:helix-turn-helix transcriptional regulator [Mesorhizobium sp. SP-1A]|uniref:helix-turn-helix transcriptional regulator n=1 Tax=Mesorhizobium sp. SP-1A TaxID=3077840 RepID=UPI0028F6DC8B|nr:helix-turn-helix transcriptional regulator [Mesorhizobium sp. SP-1A]